MLTARERKVGGGVRERDRLRGGGGEETRGWMEEWDGPEKMAKKTE